ncbi:MAG: Unknown protein, partial [uncultured Aureispira sp.]
MNFIKMEETVMENYTSCTIENK